MDQVWEVTFGFIFVGRWFECCVIKLQRMRIFKLEKILKISSLLFLKMRVNYVFQVLCLELFCRDGDGNGVGDGE